MRRSLSIHLVVCLLTGLTFGCSGDDSSDSSTYLRTRQVDETHKPHVSGTSALPAGTPVREAAGSRPSLPRGDVQWDRDEPPAAGAAPNANSMAMAIPFSPATINPPGEAAGSRDRIVDEDDPDAPVIAAKPEIADVPPPRLNDGRGGVLVPPSKQPASTPVAGTTQDETPSLQPKLQPGQPGEAALSKSNDDAARQAADSAEPDAAAGTTTVVGSANGGPDTTGTPQLAAQFAPLDQDGDGQIGLYEWPREKLAEFQRLDTNQDGFLTPGELVE